MLFTYIQLLGVVVILAVVIGSWKTIGILKAKDGLYVVLIGLLLSLAGFWGAYTSSYSLSNVALLREVRPGTLVTVWLGYAMILFGLISLTYSIIPRRKR